MSRLILPVPYTYARIIALFFSALANNQRWQILCLLAASTESLQVSRLSAKLALSENRASGQLAVLRQAGLVTGKRLGRSIFYSLKSNSFIQVTDYLKQRLPLLPRAITADTDHDIADFSRIEARLKALSSEGRWAIILVLSQRETTIKALLPQVFLEQQTVSDHLRILKKAGLIHTTSAGKYVHCQLVPQTIAEVVAIIQILFR